MRGEATDRQRAACTEQSAGGRAVDLASGDEASWTPASGSEDCVPRVRDGHLVVRVAVAYNDDAAAAKGCEPKAADIAARALAAPR
ncbi:hypothetical protein ACFVZH_18705 [Streptomyces sp. NPDC059534]|uniref:hypothetical protein n=1 Tax=Streptomyces sp. NPDC059534 TaxID=3346859 RepID=UPI00367F50FE